MSKSCQSRLSILPNKKKTVKSLLKTCKLLPKWRNFAKCGHTAWQIRKCAPARTCARCTTRCTRCRAHSAWSGALSSRNVRTGKGADCQTALDVAMHVGRATKLLFTIHYSLPLWPMLYCVSACCCCQCQVQSFCYFCNIYLTFTFSD